jgi:hypothetical protein
MNRNGRLLRVCAAAILLIKAAPLSAHHAFAAEFDIKRPIKLRGTVSRMDWVNPHSWIHLDVKDADGKIVEWMIEGGSPNALLRLGFYRPAARSSSRAFRPGTGRTTEWASPFRSRTAASFFSAGRRQAAAGAPKNRGSHN